MIKPEPKQSHSFWQCDSCLGLFEWTGIVLAGIACPFCDVPLIKITEAEMAEQLILASPAEVVAANLRMMEIE